MSIGCDSGFEDFGEFCDGVEFFVAVLCKWSGWGRILEGVGEVGRGTHGVVSGGEMGDWDLVGEKSDGIGYTRGVCGGGVDFPAAVVVFGGVDDVAEGAVRGVGSAIVWLVVREDFHAWRGERSLVVVELAIKLGVGR